jgi:Family of unknown function (DUF5670)
MATFMLAVSSLRLHLPGFDPNLNPSKSYIFNSRFQLLLANPYNRPARKRTTLTAPPARGEPEMLWTVFIILLVLWLIGVVSSYTLGGFVHILLVLAVVALLFQLITMRSPT